VDESQKYVTEYLDAKKKSEALSVPALILIAGGLTGMLISPLFGKKISSQFLESREELLPGD